jgi:hypothetical protein
MRIPQSRFSYQMREGDENEKAELFNPVSNLAASPIPLAVWDSFGQNLGDRN